MKVIHEEYRLPETIEDVMELEKAEGSNVVFEKMDISRTFEKIEKYDSDKFNVEFQKVRDFLIDTYFELSKKKNKRFIRLGELFEYFLKECVKERKVNEEFKDRKGNRIDISALEYVDRYPRQLTHALIKELHIDYYYCFDKKTFPWSIYIPTIKTINSRRAKFKFFPIIFIRSVTISYVVMFVTIFLEIVILKKGFFTNGILPFSVLLSIPLFLAFLTHLEEFYKEYLPL